MKTLTAVAIATHLLLLTSTTGAGIASRPSVERRPILKVENEDLKIGMLSRDAILRRCMYVFADLDGKIEREIPALLDGMLFFEPSTTKPHTY